MILTPPIQVPGSGPYNAKILFLGEAPGGREVERGINFCGPSGKILWNVCDEFPKEIRPTRDNTYVTNVVKVRCPGDTIRRIKEIGLRVEDYIPLMWAEIDAVKPNVILALGNTALSAVTDVVDYGKSGILKYRGSILPSSKGGYKVIPTIHPASLIERKENKGLFSFKQVQFLRFDINKCIEQSEFPDIKYKLRQFHIARTAYQLETFFRKYEGCNSHVFVDIETFRGLPVCIGFAFNPYEGISIPLVNLLEPSGKRMNIPVDELARMWRIITKVLLDNKIQKAGQNFKFDQAI